MTIVYNDRIVTPYCFDCGCPAYECRCEYLAEHRNEEVSEERAGRRDELIAKWQNRYPGRTAAAAIRTRVYRRTGVVIGL
jgi:hypothetical protein